MVNYHLKSNVINVDDGQYQTNTDDGKKVVLSKEIDARVGDIMIIPPSKIYETPKAIKVTSVNHVNNETVIEYSTPSLYEVINNISTKSWETDISRGTFIPAEGIKVQKENNSDGSLFRTISIEKNIKPEVNINLSRDFDGIKVEGSVNFNIRGKISSDILNLDFFGPKIDFMNINLKNSIDFKTEGSVRAKYSKEKNSTAFPKASLPIKIGRIVSPTPILGINIIYDLNLVTTFEGEVAVSASSKYSIENSVVLKNRKLEQEKSFNHELIFDKMELKGSVKIGPELSIAPGIFAKPLWSLSAEAGVGGEISYSTTMISIEDKNVDSNKSFNVEMNGKEFSIEKFGYLTLKSKVDILELLPKIGTLLDDFNYEFILFDGKIKLENTKNNEEKDK